jgi:hypothetical protein
LHPVYIAFMCFVWISEQTVTFVWYIINRSVFIIETESVYSAVRTESLYNTDTFRPSGVKVILHMIHWQSFIYPLRNYVTAHKSGNFCASWTTITFQQTAQFRTHICTNTSLCVKSLYLPLLH